MGESFECEFTRGARSRRSPVTASEPEGAAGPPPRGPRRTFLRTEDGVRIEAAYDPWAGSGDPGSVEPGAPAEPAIVLAHGFSGSLEQTAMRRAARLLAQYAAVVTFSFRGHGRSGGHSTVGDREVMDLAAAVRWARSLGHGHITTVGFSMGGSVAVRHGALYKPYGRHVTAPQSHGGAEGVGRGDNTVKSANTAQAREHEGRTGARRGAEPVPHPGTARCGEDSGAEEAAPEPSAHADAVVTVSAPARWYYRGTAPMRRLHWVIERPLGRLVSRYGLRTRIHPYGWDPVPLPPVAAVPAVSPAPLLIVHGDLDPYFPLDHPRSLAAAADPARTWLWIEPGFGHASSAAAPALLHRIGAWSGSRCSAARSAGHDGTRATER